VFRHLEQRLRYVRPACEWPDLAISRTVSPFLVQPPQTRPGQAKPKHARARPLDMAWHGIAWRGAGATGGDARGRRSTREEDERMLQTAPCPSTWTMNPTDPSDVALVSLFLSLSLSLEQSQVVSRNMTWLSGVRSSSLFCRTVQR
jgi:hypothetical protein